METSYSIAKALTKQSGSGGKRTFLVPTTDQITKIVTSSRDFILALDNFLTFAKQKEDTFQQLKTIPLTQENLDKLKNDLDSVKKLPYA